MKFSDVFPSDDQPKLKEEDSSSTNIEQPDLEIKQAMFLFPYPAIPPQTQEELKPIQEMVDKRVSKWLMANPNATPISSVPEVTPAKPGASRGYLMVTIFYTNEPKSITERNVKDQANETK